MSPEQKAIYDAVMQAMETADTLNPNTLVFIGIIVGLFLAGMLVLLSIFLAQQLAKSALFISGITGRSVLANEQIRRSTEEQTQAIGTQSAAISAMNQTGLNTGTAVEGVAVNVQTGLAIMKLLGIDVKTLAEHADNPTAETTKDVKKIADAAPTGEDMNLSTNPPAPPADATTPSVKITMQGGDSITLP